MASPESYQIQDISVPFPCKAYPSQIGIMEKVIATLDDSLLRSTSPHCHALLESPTGTGKTLAILASVVAWFKAHPTRNDPTRGRRKIFYAMRTHSQIKVVVNEYEKLLPNTVTMCILASREKYCNNSEARNSEDVNVACRILTQTTGSPGCRYFRNFNRVIDSMDNDLHNIEVFIRLGDDVGGCSYYAMLEKFKRSDIIFCPYAFITNPSLLAKIRESLKESILIIDEGHNYDQYARDSASFDVEELTLDYCMTEINTSSSDTRSLHILVEGLTNLIKKYKGVDPSKLSGEYAKQMLLEFDITQSLVERAKKVPWNDKTIHGLRPGLVTKLQMVLDSLGNFFKNDGIHMDDFLLCVQGKTGANTSRMQFTLSLWCLNASVVFKYVADLSLSTMITSGTLSPTIPFASELGVHFDTVFSAPHVINVTEQLWVGAISNGPDKHRLLGTMVESRKRLYQDAIGESLEAICTVVERGTLVFFPSFNFMNTLFTRWRQTGRWTTLCSKTKVFIEQRDASGSRLLSEEIQEYYDVLSEDSRNKATYLAVCRGRLAEGIDFKDDRARTVIIVGVPNLNWYDEKIKAKVAYNDKRTSIGFSTGQSWYTQQAFNAVSQAIGRCIRHKSDYGAVILLDSRYEDRSKVFDGEWFTPSIKTYTDFKTSLTDLASFLSFAENRHHISMNLEAWDP